MVREWRTWADAFDCCTSMFLVRAEVSVASCEASLFSISSVPHANLMPLRTEALSFEILDQKMVSDLALCDMS